MEMKEASLKIFTGSSNPDLAKEICNYLDVPLGDALVTAFSNLISDKNFRQV